MENINETKQLIGESKSIYIIPDSSDHDAIVASLALFYTLREMNKNVNLAMENLPENLAFLIPSLDHISYPKNFIISIPKNMADISQIYYDKDEEGLKIHLTIDKGIIKKDLISFYYSEVKPDIVITVGIKDFKQQMAEKMDSFGFLLDSPILNISNSVQENGNFGKINIIEQKPLFEIIINLINKLH